MNINLKNKRALVCGSTQGIGKAVAVEFALLGADVTLLARNPESLKKVAAELYNDGKQKHNFIAADFSKPDEVKKQIENFISENGAVHILVNNTGGPPAGNVSGAKEEDFLKAFNAHLICNHILAMSCIDGMKIENYGRIINIISTSVKQPIKGLGVSNTIRAAVGNWSKTLSLEVAQFGITVNNVLPGATNTIRLQQIIDDKTKKTGKTKAEVIEEMTHEIPMARFAEPDEIANAVAFLASPAASYINGINVPVDGGRTACL
jgi:3-oxoacyl-[acyl-carrier protein] reductase